MLWEEKGDLQSADHYVAELIEYFRKCLQENTEYIFHCLGRILFGKRRCCKSAENLLSEFEKQKGEAINVDFFG